MVGWFQKMHKKQDSRVIALSALHTAILPALTNHDRNKFIHICGEPIFERYSNALWPNIKVNKISNNTYKYSLKKSETCIKFSNNKDLFEKNCLN